MIKAAMFDTKPYDEAAFGKAAPDDLYHCGEMEKCMKERKGKCF